MEALFEAACQAIDEEAQDLKSLSHAIWSKPELMYEEHFAHDTLCDFLEKRGFHVERKYILDTAFRATWQRDGPKGERVPNIVIVCEYDALPGIGHACGHNLIAEAGVAAAIAVKAAMEKDQTFIGKVTVLGTPAEEMGAGKVPLIKAGALDEADAAMMVHPAPMNWSMPQTLAVRIVTIEYHGKSSHASLKPWEGVNALDAAVHAYNGISSLRQQIRPEARIHGVIVNGGDKANIIPDYTKMEYIVREETWSHLQELVPRVDNCFKAAALATGCEANIQWDPRPYYDMRSNSTLAQLYDKYMDRFAPGRKEGPPIKGSTDMGNISYVVPSIHPFYSIGDATNHTKEFTVDAGSEHAQPLTLNQAKGMALTCLEVMSDGALLNKIKKEFKETVPVIEDSVQ